MEINVMPHKVIETPAVCDRWQLWHLFALPLIKSEIIKDSEEKTRERKEEEDSVCNYVFIYLFDWPVDTSPEQTDGWINRWITLKL